MVYARRGRRPSVPEQLLTFRIEQDLTTKIEQGLLKAGTRICSIREAAKHYDVSRYTVATAYEHLVAQGYLNVRTGSGFYVAKVPKQPFPTHRIESCRIDGEWLMRQQVSSNCKANFGGGLLPDEWFPESDFRVVIRSLLRDPRISLASYGDSRGYGPLRERIAQMLADLKIGATTEHISLTIGASHGLELAMRALVQPGEVALVDEPGYFNLYSSLEAHGVEMVGVPRTPTGPCVATLRTLLAQNKPKVFFTQSIFHNPTGGCTDPATAYEILRLAEEHDFLIIEDDVYGCFDDIGHTRIASLDQLNRVVLVGSFSKAVSASIRTGYIAANLNLVARINRIKLNGVIGCPLFTEMAVYAFLVSGSYRKHVLRLRERLVLARDQARFCLTELGFNNISVPEGGYFVCAHHPKIDSAANFAEKAVAESILVAPGEVFTLSGAKTNWFRFNVGQLAIPTNVALLRSFINKQITTI